MIIGSIIEKHDILPSTNAYAAQMLAQGNPHEGTVVVASFQTEGKGQGSHTWSSDENKNLLFSIILFPERILPEEQPYITMAMSLGVCDGIDSYFQGSKIKPPNDIFYGNDKMAGILIENVIEGGTIKSCIVGIGLNVNQTTFPSDLPNPTSMAKITGTTIDKDECLNTILIFLDRRYKELLYGDKDKLESDYTSRLITL